MRKISIIFTLVIVSGTGILTYSGYREPKTTISPTSLKVQSFTPWNVTVPVMDIVSVDTILRKEMPRISLRSNGISLFGVNRGWFKTKDGNKVWLSLNPDVDPVIVIEERNGRKYYLNKANTKETLDLFKKLNGFTENKKE